MHPWLIHAEAVRVPTYFASLMVGMAMATFVLRREAIRSQLSTRVIYDLAILVLPAAMLGSRALYVAQQHGIASLVDPARIFSPDGGYVFYGGVALASVLVLLRTRRLGLDAWRVSDVFAPAMPFGIAFGRLGCLGAGCCHGRPADWPLGVEVPWSIRYYTRGAVPEALLGVPLHPSPLYESLLGLLLFYVVSRVRARQAFDGQAIIGMFTLYGIGRTLIEFTRGDLVRGVYMGGMISTSQLVGMGSAVVGLSVYRWRKRQCIPS